MSDPKLISPMLDDFLMGDPFSDHNGVRCCPAMKKDTEEKYIVKIISIPASQVQLDALLLTGAYPDEDSALAYFKELSDGVIEETQILQRLSQLEGFLPYESCQVVPMENGTGFEVYLLSPYKRTLEHVFRKYPMTHLGALNLGLDMCASLAVSRRSGYLYTDLKPDNIYVCGDHEYRIGDLGFLPINSLKYASLPDKYRSRYTAPEITDAFSALNTTIDIYAAGLVLYQAYNNGTLPFSGDTAPAEVFPAPAYADYEMAEIILKACAPSPEDRWQDPIQMGQALVSYMQRNGANDTPIIPVASESEDTDKDVALAEAIDESPSAPNAQEEVHPDPDAITSDPDCESVEPEAVTAFTEPDEITEDAIYSEDEQGNLTFLVSDADDETAPGQDPSDLDYMRVSDEVSEILNYADELIAHPAPEPVVAPDPIEVPMPEPIPEPEPVASEESTQTQEDVQDSAQEEATAAQSAPEEDVAEPEIYDDSEPVMQHMPAHWLRNLIILLIVGAVIFCGWFYYQNIYLQPISLVLDESDGVLTVFVDSQLDESKLTVICSDTYGNQHPMPVTDGKAVFNDLVPNSAYTVQVVATGFHQLTGKTSTAYTTPTQTNIVQLHAVTGAEDGSVILGFTVDGPDAAQWKVLYQAADEAENEVTFSGHMVTITGLTVGKEYLFTLIPDGDLHITGDNQIAHTASKLICASNLVISDFSGNSLTVSWTAPEDAQVDTWTVRCYNEKGYDKSVATGDLSATFDGISATDSYTIEVSAAGMSVGERVFVTENAITVRNFGLVLSEPGMLTLSWESSAVIDSRGWILRYTVNGTNVHEISGFSENTASVLSVIPGAEYQFTLQTLSGTSVFGGTFTCIAPNAEPFDAFGVTADDLEFYMCRTPEEEDWDRNDLSMSDFVTDFTIGEKASFLVHMQKGSASSTEPITTMYIIRDSEGTIVSTAMQDSNWDTMWANRYCELDIPALPETAGTYNISIYFNGMLAFSLDFTLTQS